MSVTAEKAAAAGTTQLDVSLDPKADPAVVVSDRKPTVPAGDKIKWKKNGSGPDFKFVEFQTEETAFENVDLRNDKIECDFNPPGSGGDVKEYAYTIVVTDGKNEYTSDESTVTDPTGGRAVIRN